MSYDRMKKSGSFTDKDSKILEISDRFEEGYNCQVAVDSPQVPAVVRLIKINTDRQAQEISAGAGYRG